PARRILTVNNAKHSNGRGGTGVRTMHLDTDEVHFAVMDHLVEARARMAEGCSWTDYQQQCSRTITKAARRIWWRRKRRPCLYSARHQFAADNKRAKRSLEQIAALMGHGSPNTARAFYGRTSAGYKPPATSLISEPSPRPTGEPTPQERY